MAAIQPIMIDAADVSRWVARLWWPVLRIGGFVLSAPIASETTIPSQVKIALSIGLAFILSPLAPVPDRYLTRENDLILCGSHGALFRIGNGLCVAGPCAGKHLRPVPLQVESGFIMLAENVDPITLGV